jgi:transposase InsO family protein/ribonuclease HI
LIELGPVDAQVVPSLPGDVDIVLGLDVIYKNGLVISPIAENNMASVKFHHMGLKGTVADVTSPLKTITDSDFVASFSGERWSINWNWKHSDVECHEGKGITFASPSDRQAFDEEVASWIEEGVLVEHDPGLHGEVRHFLPMFGVRQVKGDNCKVRPVFDFRVLNSRIESHPGGATPLCADRLREWRQQGQSCAVLDLRKAYLQVHVDKSLWVYQAVRWKGKVYLLTRLGFGLASAPKIMTAIVETVMAEDPAIDQSVSNYIDDLFVNTSFVSVDQVREHFRRWGLLTKDPEHLGEAHSVRVLGLRIDKSYRWQRDGSPPSVVGNGGLTRRQAHALLGEWIGHFPVNGWLRVACSYIQRLTADEKIGWDEPVSDEVLSKLHHIEQRIATDGDPARGQWDVNQEAPMTVWTDASSLALGVALQVHGEIVEDAAWLRPKNDSAHINRAELDAAIRGINLALKWGKRELRIMCDSATVCGWLNAVIEKTHNVKTTALSEILIRRRLDTLREIIEQEKLKVSVHFVRSSENLADPLTRVPTSWLSPKRDEEVVAAPALTAVGNATLDDVRIIHDRCHFGVDRTLELARERYGKDKVSKRMARKVVARCHQCARIDPASTHRWVKGAIVATETWQRLAVDITHYNNRPHLTVTDVASHFTIWRELRGESSAEVTHHLRQIVSEFGPPESIISDNGTVFRSREMREMLETWGIDNDLSCAYRPQGNAVAERMHRTVKRAACRSGRSISEAVFWVNNTKGDRTATPYEFLFCASSRKPGITNIRKVIDRPQLSPSRVEDHYRDYDRNPFVVGERVYLRPPNGRCDVPWTGPHIVTAVRSSVSLELDDDGVSRHVSHVRSVPGNDNSDNGVKIEFGDNDEHNLTPTDMQADSDTSPSQSNLRRSDRAPKRPSWWEDYVT